MFYRLEIFDKEENEWVGMFSDDAMSGGMHRDLFFTTATYQFKRFLATINPENYTFNGKTGHCYFTEKGMEKFEKYVIEYRNVLVTELETKFSAVKEDTYKIVFQDSQQVILID